MTKQPIIAIMLGNQEKSEGYGVIGKNAYYNNSYIGTFELELEDYISIKTTLVLHNGEKIVKLWKLD